MLINNPKEWGDYVRSLRKEQKLSQSDAGALVGLKQKTLSTFEQNPEQARLDTAFRLLAAVGLELHIVPKGSPLATHDWEKVW